MLELLCYWPCVCGDTSVVGGLGDVLVACGLGASELAAVEEVPDCSAVLVVPLPLVVLVLSSAKFAVTQNKILTQVLWKRLMAAA